MSNLESKLIRLADESARLDTEIDHHVEFGAHKRGFKAGYQARELELREFLHYVEAYVERMTDHDLNNLIAALGEVKGTLL
jgi:hypothetical protein